MANFPEQKPNIPIKAIEDEVKGLILPRYSFTFKKAFNFHASFYLTVSCVAGK
jgi:hypothetical protein